jgi:hypothetical protein
MADGWEQLPDMENPAAKWLVFLSIFVLFPLASFPGSQK